MNVRVRLFGEVAEKASTGIISVNNVVTTIDIRRRIKDEMPELAGSNYALAVNHVVIDGDVALEENDEVALLSPFSGG